MTPEPTYEELEQRVRELKEEVSERKLDEEALQTKEKLIEALLNNQIDAATIVDKELKMVYVNKFLADRFGRSVDEMIGLSPEDVGDKSDIVTAKRVAYFRQVATTGKSVRFEDKREEIWFDTVVTPVLDKEGQVIQVAILARDITDKKLVEQALVESEERYRLLAENATDVIWTTDTNLKFTYSSPSVERLCGYTPEEAVTRSAKESLSSESFEVAMNIFTEEMALVQQANYPVGITRTHDLELTCKDGSTVWAEVSMRFLFEDERNLVGVLGISRDITDRMRAEESLKNAHDELERRVENRTAELIKANKLLKEENEARKLTEEMLRESEETVRSLLSSPADIAIVTDTEGIVLFANEAAALRYNRKVDEVIGLSIWDLTREISPSLAERRRAFAREVIQTAKPVRFEDERGGTWFDNIYMPIFDAKGKITKLAGLVRDVTERKQTEEALQESEEKYRSMMEAMVEPSYICTSDFHVSYMNPAMIKRTGHDATGEHCYKALNDLNERCPWCVHDAVQKGESLETKIVSPKDGSSFLISNSPIFHQDGSISKMTIYRDITEHKQAEQDNMKLQDQLQQAQKMESLGTLAGGIAHDFNNLLMAIQGRTSIMLMKKDSSHPDFGHLKGIEDNVDSAADLTKQLLGFARGGKYEVKPTDMNELIKKQNRMFGRTKKEITIRGKYEENPWSVEVDRGQIEQVLLNLYINAWQAMPGGGNLNLQTENATLDENYVKPFSIEPGRYVKISVTDTGVGMDKATQEKIFEPFFTSKELGRGTGLGLASVYGIIKNHGGFINVYSEKGHGTTFNIYLPASEKEVIEEKKPAGDTVRGSETVLFIDDEDMIIEVAEELFEQLGYKLLIARSGKEAIETYEKNKELIDIVLLDMIMPDMSGSDTYDRMKELDPDIKVLLSSGYSLEGRATEILDRGCNGFIQKPFKMKELSQKLREILDKK